ncbi:hypothetical protein RRG08_046454 [Elysia crispata]|uniref:Uncharacterized protein n=1 Tax=Elysia crispata TaxID=231223 RepID=A0AAE0YIA8_9GAST|nr:hypothetical protein RRG08_046454 [Elysia crispata]
MQDVAQTARYLHQHLSWITLIAYLPRIPPQDNSNGLSTSNTSTR